MQGNCITSQIKCHRAVLRCGCTWFLKGMGGFVFDSWTLLLSLLLLFTFIVTFLHLPDGEENIKSIKAIFYYCSYNVNRMLKLKYEVQITFKVVAHPGWELISDPRFSKSLLLPLYSKITLYISTYHQTRCNFGQILKKIACFSAGLGMALRSS